MAFSLLLSLPGIPVIYYGDEVGAKNDINFAKEFAEQREYIQKKNKIKLLSYFDSRDIHRGVIPSKLFYGAQKNWYKQNSKIYNNVSEMIEARKENIALTRGHLNVLKTKRQEVFAYTRDLKPDKILVVNNLSDEKIIAEVDFPVNTVLKQGTKSIKFKNLLNDRDYKAEVSLTNRKIFIPLQPYEFLWLKAENEVL
jgi:maltose alpha-D-glucosyltransferase/alpha-amylase